MQRKESDVVVLSHLYIMVRRIINGERETFNGEPIIYECFVFIIGTER